MNLVPSFGKGYVALMDIPHDEQTQTIARTSVQKSGVNQGVGGSKSPAGRNEVIMRSPELEG